jgi:hypothetical protein
MNECLDFEDANCNAKGECEDTGQLQFSLQEFTMCQEHIDFHLPTVISLAGWYKLRTTQVTGF